MNSSGAGVATVLALALACAAALWVWVDAGRRGMNQAGWTAGTLLLLIVFLPAYFIMRRRPLAAPAAVPGHAPPAPTAPSPASGFPTKRAAALAAFILVAVLYGSGRMDQALYKVGLNLHDCGQNAFGAVYCGQALTDYNNSVDAAQQKAAQELQQLQQQSEAAAAQAQADAQAQEQQLQAQEQADQNNLCTIDPTTTGCP